VEEVLTALWRSPCPSPEVPFLEEEACFAPREIIQRTENLVAQFLVEVESLRTEGLHVGVSAATVDGLLLGSGIMNNAG
jgi:hypothetical protein